MKAFLGVALVAIALPVLGQTDQVRQEPLTLYGVSGLFRVPTASGLRYREVSLGTVFEPDRRGPSIAFGLPYGLEVHGAYINREGQEDKFTGGAKVAFTAREFQGVQVAAGILDVADALKRSGFFVATWTTDENLPEGAPVPRVGLRLTAGYGTGVFRDSAIGGGEIIIDRRLSLIADYDGVDFAPGVRFRPASYVSAQLGFAKEGLIFGFSTSARF